MPLRWSITLTFILTSLAVGVPILLSADDAQAEQAVALLDARCFKCHSHSAGKNKGGLVLDVQAAVLKGGDTGPAVTAGDPTKGLLLEYIVSPDPDTMMPPKGDRLTKAEVALLTNWVKAGALWPASRVKSTQPGRYLPGTIGAKEKSWWAYQPVQAFTPPAGSAANPIDRFIDARLVQEGLTPAPAAERSAWLRRATFDVTGLPPSPAELAAFSADQSPTADAHVIDRLLASPHYGERMARQWLDLVRYADSDGYRADDARPFAWRYRDYVVRAYNENKPYDRFVQEQLAGDELFPGDPAALTATGYLRHWIYEYNNRDARGQWENILNDITDTTGDVFLGAGMQCARCHDHKFDPILQRDYFALRSFFANILPVEDRAAFTATEAQAYQAQWAKWQAQADPLLKQIDALEATYRKNAAHKATIMFPEDIQAMLAKAPTARTPYETQVAALAYRQVDYEYARLDRSIKGEARTKLADLRKQLEAFDDIKPADRPVVLAVRETGTLAPDVVIPKKNTVVQPAFLSVLSATVPAPPLTIAPFSELGTSGRRATLARWLTDPTNPFTARLAVNRMWQLYFRRGIAPHAGDFGRLGEPPAHPELLDFLAAELVRTGWDQKAVHRLILLSAAYRRSSSHPAPAAGQLKDPQNTLVWRAQPQRLEAEQIRDALFTATGELKLTKTHGAGEYFTTPVRSIFTRFARNNRDPIFDAFDAPLWFGATTSRDVTTTPIQSLLLLNSPFMLRRGEALAARVQKETSAQATPTERVQHLYALLYQRAPQAHELQRALNFLATQSQAPAVTKAAAALAEFSPEKIPNRDGQAAHFEREHRTPFTANQTADLDLSRGFTIEATIVPRSVSDSGTLRVIAAKGTGSKEKPTWQLGLTGLKSRRAPMVLAFQSYGTLADGSFGEAVAFSGLRIEMNKPYFVSAAIRYATKTKPGEVTFNLKDLSNDDEQLLVDKVALNLATAPLNMSAVTLGGNSSRDASSFHGAIDDVRLSNAPLTPGQLLFTSEDPRPETLGFWRFENRSGVLADSSGHHCDLTGAKAKAGPATSKGSPLPDRALSELCHALLNSTEFLYLE